MSTVLALTAPKDLLLVALALICSGLTVALARRRRAPGMSPRRILFPFAGEGLSEPVLSAALRLARAEHATLVPALLVRVPMAMPLTAPIPRQCGEALPLLEAVEQRAARAGIPVDTRIERGRTYRHALRELLEHERYDRLIVPAEDFGGADVAWLLEHAGGEVVVLRPARIPSVA